MRRQSWQDLVNAGLGLWIFVSAAFLRHAMTDATWWHSMVRAPPPEGVSGAAMWNLAIVGAAVVTFALFAALAFNAWQEWGIWRSASGCSYRRGCWGSTPRKRSGGIVSLPVYSLRR